MKSNNFTDIVYNDFISEDESDLDGSADEDKIYEDEEETISSDEDEEEEELDFSQLCSSEDDDDDSDEVK